MPYYLIYYQKFLVKSPCVAIVLIWL